MYEKKTCKKWEKVFQFAISHVGETANILKKKSDENQNKILIPEYKKQCVGES